MNLVGSTEKEGIIFFQVAIEGAINKESIRHALSRGLRPSGDLLPWTLSQSFIDEDFGSLNGARIVRLAVHPSLQRMGYGSEAVRQLISFLENHGDLSILDEKKSEVRNGDVEQTVSKTESKTNETHRNSISSHNSETSTSSDHSDATQESTNNSDGDANERTTKKPVTTSSLHTEIISVRDAPPLLVPCDRKVPITVDYIGTSFGLTLDLLKFHNRLGFQPVYLRQTPNPVTGQRKCSWQ